MGWMILGGTAGIKLMPTMGRFRAFAVGAATIVIPLGGVIGALCGALLGLIRNLSVRVVMMAAEAGSAAGAVAGGLP